MLPASPAHPRLRHPTPLRLLAVSLFVALGLAACAPHLQLPGPTTTTPQVSGDAIVAPDGARLPLRVWAPEEPPKAVILALHGFNDYSNAFDDAGRFWAKRGVITYAYDQRGFGGAPNHGLWAGIDAYVADLRMAANLLRGRHPGVPFYILGSSMGGAVVLVTMASDAPPANDGIILVAPAVWSRDFMPFYQTIPLWISAHTVPWMRLTGSGLSIRASDNIEMLRRFAADPMVIKATRIDAVHGLANLMDAALDAAPRFSAHGLILYGKKDEVVPDTPTFTMIRRLPAHNPPRNKIAIYDNGYHMLLRDLQAETVMGDVLAWLQNPDAALPSGADQMGRTLLGLDAASRMAERASDLSQDIDRP